VSILINLGKKIGIQATPNFLHSTKQLAIRRVIFQMSFTEKRKMPFDHSTPMSHKKWNRNKKQKSIKHKVTKQHTARTKYWSGYW